MASAAPYTSAAARPVPAARQHDSSRDMLGQFEAVGLDMLAAGALLEAIDSEVADGVMSPRGELLIVAMRSLLANTNAKMGAAVGDLIRPC